MCIKWCGENVNRLFTGGCDYSLHAYNVMSSPFSEIGKSDIETHTTSKDEKEVVHEDTILDLLPIPDMNLIATASMDSNICLWTMDTLQGKSILTDH